MRVLIFILFVSLSAFANVSDTLVKVDSGLIRGFQKDTLSIFRGIPYAEPPIGSLRWAPPQPPIPWQGVRDAEYFTAQCVQNNFSKLSDPIFGSEDCLTLNIWTPSINAPGTLPVMVWFHGGYSNWGSSSVFSNGVYMYDGSGLAQKGIIVVTVNYRLGPFGFLAHPSLSNQTSYHGSGNYGYMDQIAALQWVQRNISKFGGNASAVTIFGHSAGGASVDALIASPLAKGLISRAIVQSGGFTHRALSAGEGRGVEVATALGCSNLQTAADCLREKSEDSFFSALPKAFDNGGKYFKPVIDGYVLPDSVMNLVLAGKHNQVPIIIGTTENEWSSLIGHFLTTPIVTETDYKNAIIYMLGKEHVDDIVQHYPLDQFADGSHALLAVLNDWDATCPSTEEVKALADHQSAPVYRYFYRHIFHSSPLADRGAFHGAELPFIFNNFSPKPDYVPDQQELQFSEEMMSYWVQFAKTGDPNDGNHPVWTKYNSATDNYLELDETTIEKAGLRTDACKFWKQYQEN